VYLQCVAWRKSPYPPPWQRPRKFTPSEISIAPPIINFFPPDLGSRRRSQAAAFFIRRPPDPIQRTRRITALIPQQPPAGALGMGPLPVAFSVKSRLDSPLFAEFRVRDPDLGELTPLQATVNVLDKLRELTATFSVKDSGLTGAFTDVQQPTKEIQ